MMRNKIGHSDLENSRCFRIKMRKMQIFLCLYFHIYFFANIFISSSAQIDTVSLILYNKLVNTAWL